MQRFAGIYIGTGLVHMAIRDITGTVHYHYFGRIVFDSVEAVLERAAGVRGTIDLCSVAANWLSDMTIEGLDWPTFDAEMVLPRVCQKVVIGTAQTAERALLELAEQEWTGIEAQRSRIERSRVRHGRTPR